MKQLFYNKNTEHRIFTRQRRAGNTGFTCVLYAVSCILILLSATQLLNTYDKETETVIVLGKASYTPYQDEYEKMLYPTVRITSPAGTGSGVVISYKLQVSSYLKPETYNLQPETLILTAAHVVDKQSVVDIELYNSTVITASVVITDTAKDLALLYALCDSVVKIYSARLAPKDYTPYLFAPVWAVGCSLGLKPRPSFGHITYIETKELKNQGTKEQVSPSFRSSVLQSFEVSSPVLPGNSGGPVYDARTFEVIGIAVWVKVYQYQLVTTMAGIVPINEIYDFLDSVKNTSKGQE